MKTPTKDFDLKIIGEIGPETLFAFLEAVKGKEEISIFLYTGGGSVETATCIKDYIEHHKIKATITCGGRCESAGTTILAAGSRRIAYKNCIFMFHQMYAANPDTNERTDDNSRKKLDFFKALYSKIYPTIKLSPSPDDCKYLTAKEMYVEGLIDEILA